MVDESRDGESAETAPVHRESKSLPSAPGTPVSSTWRGTLPSLDSIIESEWVVGGAGFLIGQAMGALVSSAPRLALSLGALGVACYALLGVAYLAPTRTRLKGILRVVVLAIIGVGWGYMLLTMADVSPGFDYSLVEEGTRFAPGSEVDGVKWEDGFRRFEFVLTSHADSPEAINVRVIIAVDSLIAGPPVLRSQVGIEGLQMKAPRASVTKSVGGSRPVQIEGDYLNLVIVDAVRIFPAAQVRLVFVVREPPVGECSPEDEVLTLSQRDYQERMGELRIDKSHVNSGQLTRDSVTLLPLWRGVAGTELVKVDAQLAKDEYRVLSKGPTMNFDECASDGGSSAQVCVSY